MKPSPLRTVALLLAGAVLLGWLWRSSRHAAPRSATPRTALRPTSPAVAPALETDTVPDPFAASLDPETRALLAALERNTNRRDVRPREALLAFKDDAAMRAFLDRAAKSGLTLLGQADSLRTVRVRYDDFSALQNELRRNAGDYSAVSANPLVNIPTVPPKENRAALDQIPFGNDTLAFLGATGDRSQWGRGTTIAILDSGVATDATFGAGRLRALDIGLGIAPGKGEGDGHGTSVASLAAGMSPDAAGVAPAANILSIRVTDAAGVSDIFTLSQGIVAAVDAGARIVNVSLGGYATNATLSNAIAYAQERGAIVVAAAGNDQAAQLAWPAADTRVVSVGAVDKAEQQVSFSNSGPQLKLSAPGYGVQTAWLDGQRAYVDGTSASAPLVSGAIAAVMSQNPSLTAQQAVQLLTRTASDAGAPGADPAFGNGILNLGWAMNSGTAGYIDTAISSHYFDAENNQMDFVVQNRSGQPVSGLRLDASIAGMAMSWSVPSLTPGETFVAKAPVDAATLKNNGGIRYATQLVNPTGLVDRVPANNRKSSVLTPPAGP